MEYIRVIMYRSGIPAESVLGHTPGASIGFSDLPPKTPMSQYMRTELRRFRLIRNGHSHVTRYAIVEPWPITPGYDKLGLHHVQTRLGEGLSESDAARAKALLARPDGGFCMWSVTGLRVANNPNKPVHKPGSKVDGGVCTYQMLGSTLLIECTPCKKVRAEGDKEAAAGAPLLPVACHAPQARPL